MNEDNVWRQKAEEARQYVNNATNPAERQFRKMEVHAYMYSAGPIKLPFYYVLKEERLWRGG